MTQRQRETLHDLFAVIARTDAATPSQRERAGDLANRMRLSAMLDDLLNGRTRAAAV